MKWRAAKITGVDIAWLWAMVAQAAMMSILQEAMHRGLSTAFNEMFERVANPFDSLKA